MRRSPTEHGVLRTLGTTVEVQPSVATCKVVDGKLEWADGRDALSIEPRQALIRGY